MAARMRKPRFCSDDASTGCGSPVFNGRKKQGALNLQCLQLLDKQGSIVDRDERDRFAGFLEESVRVREMEKQRSAVRDRSDIISMIVAAHQAEECDEAIWRSFLATHFGRASASHNIENQIESSSNLLCGFGVEPKWTWNEVQKNRKLFRDWLYDHQDELRSLSFGNHRKYESKKADSLWNVIESFIDLADEYGGPMGIFMLDAEGDDPFHTLYRRLSKLHRFGRTGRFDFLVLLMDLKLIPAEPKSCYLQGATGPKQGAIRLWGERPIGELEWLATEIAVECGVSPIVVEDALCNWQK